MTGHKAIISLLLCCLALPAGAERLRVAAHIHGGFSNDGGIPLADIAREASAKKLDALLLTDTALAALDYGLAPLPELLKLRISRRSVLKAGARQYLDEVNAVRKAFPGIVFVPGAEATAYYRWSGSPFVRLTLNDWNRHMLICGLENASDYRNLPLAGADWPYPLLGRLLLLPGLAWCARKIYYCKKGFGIAAAIAGAGAIGNMSFAPYSPYAATTPWGPYRDLISYAHKKGALAFWAHPEASNWKEPQRLAGQVFARTAPYTDCLENAPEADGFGIFMEGYKRMSRPGAEWDAALAAYARGERKNPPWGIAELDLSSFRETAIDSAYMLVDAESRSAPAVLDALKRGSFQSLAKSDAGAIEIDTFTVRGAGQGETAYGAYGSLPVRINIKASGAIAEADVTVVRNGKVLLSGRRTLPASIAFDDPAAAGPGGCGFYRVMADYVNSRAYSNPVFFCAGERPK